MKVFLSSSHLDRQAAQEFQSGLTACGFDVWADSRIHPGEGLIENISSAMAEADVVVLLFGRPSERSSWSSLETGMAAAAGKPLVPVIVDSRAKVPVILQGLRRLDATDPSRRREQIRELCAVLGEPVSARSPAAALDAVRQASRALGIERAAYEHDFARRSAALDRAHLITAAAAVIAAGLALIAVSTADDAVVAAISAGLAGAALVTAILLIAEEKRGEKL